MQTVKLYWNFTDKKWNLVEIGTVIPKDNYSRCYVVPAEANFINPRKSRLVRLAWKLHLFLIKFAPKNMKKTNENSSAFLNSGLGVKWENNININSDKNEK